MHSAPPPGCGCEVGARQEGLGQQWVYYGAAAQAVLTGSAVKVRAKTMVGWGPAQGSNWQGRGQRVLCGGAWALEFNIPRYPQTQEAAWKNITQRSSMN